MSMDYIEKHIATLQDVSVDKELVESATTYKVNGTLFAIYYNQHTPKRISLRGDEQLTHALREQYESVVLPDNLDRKTWNTFILTPQFTEQTVIDFITHSYIESGGIYLR